MAYQYIKERLEDGKVVVMDGGLGTDLRRRGVEDVDDPHIWSARALLTHPHVMLDVHRDHLLAGAQVITAGAFRTNRRALSRAGLDALARPLTHFAVKLALETKRIFGESWQFAVAGNLTSLEDCFSPGISPGLASLSEHREKVVDLEDAGAELLLMESISSFEEAQAALAATVESHCAVWLSLVLDPDVRRPRMLDGTPISGFRSLFADLPRQPDAVLFNCCSPESVTAALPVLRDQLSCHIGGYANVEREYEVGQPWIRREDMSPEAYADVIGGWIESGASIVGGCCGTTPTDTRMIRERVGWMPRPGR